jgi:hypothetical protein
MFLRVISALLILSNLILTLPDSTHGDLMYLLEGLIDGREVWKNKQSGG